MAITVNGKKFNYNGGGHIQVTNNQLYINGKLMDADEDEKVININIIGDVDSLEVDCCNKLDIKGNCKEVSADNGDLVVHGDIQGNATTSNGNITSF